MHQRSCSQDENKTMFQSDVTGHRMVKYQVHDPESMPQKGHYRRGGPQEAAGEVVRAVRGLFQWEQTGTSVLDQNTQRPHIWIFNIISNL